MNRKRKSSVEAPRKKSLFLLASTSLLSSLYDEATKPLQGSFCNVHVEENRDTRHIVSVLSSVYLRVSSSVIELLDGSLLGPRLGAAALFRHPIRFKKSSSSLCRSPNYNNQWAGGVLIRQPDIARQQVVLDCVWTARHRASMFIGGSPHLSAKQNLQHVHLPSEADLSFIKDGQDIKNLIYSAQTQLDDIKSIAPDILHIMQNLCTSFKTVLHLDLVMASVVTWLDIFTSAQKSPNYRLYVERLHAADSKLLAIQKPAFGLVLEPIRDQKDKAAEWGTWSSLYCDIPERLQPGRRIDRTERETDIVWMSHLVELGLCVKSQLFASASDA
jgi:hypothetical protein